MSIYDYYITPEEYKIAARNGINKNVLEKRIRAYGWTKKRALTFPVRKKSKFNRKLVELAEQNGICYSTFSNRVYSGMSEEKAATVPLEDITKRREIARKALEARRKYPKKYTELAEKNGIGYNTFKTRMRNGWNIEEAATRPVMTKREIGLLTKEKRQPSHLFVKE